MKISPQLRNSLRVVINKNFTFADLSKRFINVDSSTGNIFCPFHQNTRSPAAKMYWDESKELWVLHCFGECHRNYTAYDYVDLILCKAYQKYDSPYEFLEAHLSKEQLSKELESSKRVIQDNSQNSLQKKIDYINNVYNKYENLIEYIENLYMA